MQSFTSKNLAALDKSTWEVVRFGDMAFNISERVEPGNTDAEIYVGLEHLDSDSIHIRRKGKPSDVKGTKLRVYTGDIIFGKRRAYQRKAAIADFDGICSAHAMVLRANPEKIEPDLFPFFIHSDAFMNRAVEISEGSLSPTIKWKILAEQEFSLPPRDMQKKLAELFWALDDVENSLADAEALLNILHERVAENLLPKLTDICKHDYVKLSDIVNISGGSTPSRNIAEYWDGDILWLTPTDVTRNNNFEISETKEKITSQGLKAISKKLYPVGSVLMTSRATIGECVINKMPMSTNQGFTNFICSDKILNYFLLYTLVHNKKYLLKMASGSTFLEISKASVKNTYLVLPTVSKQKDIVHRIGKIYQFYENIEHQRNNITNLKKSILNLLF